MEMKTRTSVCDPQ